MTVALAKALDEAGLDVAVFDANVHVPDAPVLLGAEGPVRSTPTGRPIPIDVDGIEVISVELIAEDGPVAWRGAMVHDVVADLLGNADWTDRDVLLIDLPPGIGDGVYTIVQQDFLEDHLGRWTPRFSETVEEQTGDAFYRELAVLVAKLVAADAERFGAEPDVFPEEPPSPTEAFTADDGDRDFRCGTCGGGGSPSPDGMPMGDRNGPY